jgi:hypothetical protein
VLPQPSYIPRDIVALHVLDNAQLDIDRLSQIPARQVHARLLTALFEHIGELEDSARVLTQWPGYNANPAFNTKGFTHWQNRGYNLYRLRPLTQQLWEYRVLYAYDAEYEDIYVLAVVIKRPNAVPANASAGDYYNYENDHLITKRVCDDYDSFGIPRTH